MKVASFLLDFSTNFNYLLEKSIQIFKVIIYSIVIFIILNTLKISRFDIRNLIPTAYFYITTSQRVDAVGRWC